MQTEVVAARASVDTAMDDPAQKFTADANLPAETLPVASGGASGATTPLNGAAHPSEPEPAAAVETAGDVAPARDKSGA